MTTATAIAKAVRKLSLPQLKFCASGDEFPAFVGGYGSGKTHAGLTRATAKKLAYPECNVAYYLPTYDLIKQIAYPRFSAYFDALGVPYELNSTDHIFHLNGGQWGQVILRTLDKPSRIVGYEVADSLVDELDTLPIDKARECWEKIIARNRQNKHDGSLNTVGVVTTPEGFRFTYEQWAEDPDAESKGYKLFHAPTSANIKHLPKNYIQTLYDTYPEALREAYLQGRFVNLTSGSVYPTFNRKRNNSNETIQPNEALHVGMDFNVTKMAAAIHVLRNDDTPHAVSELVDVFDTPAMCKLLTDRFKDKGHPIIVYPDATGKARDSSGASETDLSLLRKAGFKVMVNSHNPLVRDRIVSFNVRLWNGKEARYFVNVAKCPHLTQGLEKQAYDKNGEPDKSTGVDHIIDGAGYFVVYRYPIVKRIVHVGQFSL